MEKSRTIAAIEVYGPPACGESYTAYLRNTQKCSECTAPCSNRSGLPMSRAQYCGVLTRMAVALLAAPVLSFTGGGPRECDPRSVPEHARNVVLDNLPNRTFERTTRRKTMLRRNVFAIAVVACILALVPTMSSASTPTFTTVSAKSTHK